MKLKLGADTLVGGIRRQSQAAMEDGEFLETESKFNSNTDPILYSYDKTSG